MIHFKLRNPAEIAPAGQENNLYLSWFWLTEGDLWLSLGTQIIYEYSEAAIQYFGCKTTPYNDYYIARFLEDFSALFKFISSPLPREFYDLTTNVDSFMETALRWLDTFDIDNDIADHHWDNYHTLCSWIAERSLSSGHLTGGPRLCFFRHGNTLRITWETDLLLENGIQLWTAQSGSTEVDFRDFINTVKSFGERFFREMEYQIKTVQEMNWQGIRIDKAVLATEQLQRQSAFEAMFSLLEHPPTDATDWTTISMLYQQMRLSAP